MSETQHLMRRVELDKVVVNIGVGEAGERLVKAETVLAQATGVTPVRTRARKASRDWGVRKGQEIGVKATLRGEKAAAFIKAALWARNNKIPEYSFDESGNLSFGIVDHTEFESMRYDPETGVFGMDVTVVFARPGMRVRRRRIRPAAIGRHHRVTPAEARAYMVDQLGAEVVQ